MCQYTVDHVFILPHAEEYQRLYDISLADVLLCLNTPDIHEGLSSDHYTVEKTIGDHKVYLYYFLTLPWHARQGERYVIVDFIGYTALPQ